MTSSQLYAEDALLLAEVMYRGSVWLTENVRTEAEVQDILLALYRIDRTIFWALPETAYDKSSFPWDIPERKPGLMTLAVEALHPDEQRGAFRQLCKDYPLTLCATFPGIKIEGLRKLP